MLASGAMAVRGIQIKPDKDGGVYLEKCWDVAVFEPDTCNMYPDPTRIHGCELVGYVRLCGEYFPLDAEES